MWGKSQGKSLILCQLGITQRILFTLHPKSWKLKWLENEDRNIDGLQKKAGSKCKRGLFVNINQLMQGQ